jgi:pimeloyl-ACP methyl ester carboxylesterase
MAREVRGPQGRVLKVFEAGDPAGAAIVYHHGTPAVGDLFAPWAEDAAARGARLIAYDRPGYGGSAPHPDRRVADAAADVAAILDALGIERCATWGVSGGGPHALACGALLGDRVVAGATLGSVAPFDAEGLNYLAGMGRENWVEFGAALVGREVLEPIAQEGADAMLAATPEQFTDLMRTLISPVDEDALAGGIAAFWSGQMPRVFAQGIEGWIEDDFAFVEPFGFRPSEIGTPWTVWHGRHDRFVPPSHGEWLAAAIPGAERHIGDDDGHLTLLADRIPAVHEWLLARF